MKVYQELLQVWYALGPSSQQVATAHFTVGYTVGFWYTQGFLDSGFSLFAYSNDDSRTDVIQMVKEYGGIEYEINLSEKEKGWYYVTAKVGE